MFVVHFSHAHWNRLAAFIIVAVLLAIGLSGPAHAAEDDVVFEGAGLGHGVGMSQWGAYQRAVSGDSYSDILFHYFKGSALDAYDDTSPGHGALHVNVQYDVTDLELVVRDTGSLMEGGGHSPLTVTRDGQGIDLTTGQTVAVESQATNTCTLQFGASDGSTIATWDEGSCDVSFVWDGDADIPSTKIEIAGCMLKDFDAGVLRPCQYGRGVGLSTIDNSSPTRNPPGMDSGYDGFDVILEIDIDDYVLGISEVSYTWPTEALKAQVVAARSYAAAQLDSENPLSQKCACHVKDTSADQRYVGWGHVGTNATASRQFSQLRWIDAVDVTLNQVLTHEEAPYNDVVLAVYSSSNGGASEAAHEHWPGTPKEYFSSVPDSESLIPAGNSFRSWTVSYSSAYVASRVWSDGKVLSHVAVVDRNTSGSARTIAFGPDDGSEATLKSVAWVVSTFGLPSWYFDAAFGDPSPLPLPPTPANLIEDIGATIHAADIEYLAEHGVAIGCSTDPDRFCPDDRMRREDLAAFMVRALGLPHTTIDYFHDDDGLPYEADINALAAAGITKGCNPPVNDEFCPDDTVSRGQTAAFIVRAWGLSDAGGGDRFADDDSSVFEADIERLAHAGITKGCNPPSNTSYCPQRLLSRAEMSSFLARALRDL